MQICIVKSSKSSSVHMHNFDSNYGADKIILTKKCQLFACMDKNVCPHVLNMCPDTDAHNINKNEAHTYLVALKNCPFILILMSVTIPNLHSCFWLLHKCSH